MTDEVRGTSGKTYTEKLFDWCAGVPLKNTHNRNMYPSHHQHYQKKQKKRKKTNQRIFTANHKCEDMVALKF